MAESNAPRASQRGRAAGGGRTANTEPRLQIFTGFNGMNIQNSPANFDYVFDRGSYNRHYTQTDLPYAEVVIQNNASVASNNTIETRQNMVTLFNAPEGTEFTGVTTLIGKTMYAATNDDQVRYGDIADSGLASWAGTVDLTNNDDREDNAWTFLGRADDHLVGMTSGRQIWTDPLNHSAPTLRNAQQIPNPPVLTFDQLTGRGDLNISADINEAHPFRVSLRYTRLNKFGPTLPSPPLTFFANRPTIEWSGAAFLQIAGTEPTGYDISAIELYFTEDEYQDPAFLARVDLATRNGGAWNFNWTGYLFDTSMWAIANLTIPNENHTSGVPASKMTSHDGRLYFWGGEPSHRLWIGGNPGNRFSVSTGTGGGFADCGPGEGTIVRSVPKFKTAGAASIVTMLCDNVNSQQEHRFNLVENNITISNEQSVKGWQAEQIDGSVGTKSFYGATVAHDALFAVSRYGLMRTRMTMEYNNQVRVESISDNIEPVFLDKYGTQLSEAVLFDINDTLYMTFGRPSGNLDKVIFVHDINGGGWWTYTLDIDEPILQMIQVDYEGAREGIGIITPSHIYLLPTTKDVNPEELPNHELHIETAELAVQQPLQSMFHFTQLEFRFDYFIGDIEIDVVMVDRFGRTIHNYKRVSHDTLQNQLSEYVRIDQVTESYKVIIRGKANMRLTHWVQKYYPLSNRIGTKYGFDNRASHSSKGSIHRYFRSYNDLRDAVIP